MRKVLAFIVILQLFTNQEAFAEMAKLPFLFHHYSETAQGTDFIRFIHEHYADDHQGSEDHEHGKLPFKHSDDGCSHHSTSSAFKDTKSESSLGIHHITGGACKYPVTDEKNFPTYSGNIWQPPKLRA